MTAEYFRTGDGDTICALSTAPGTGGIAVIRVSGSRAAEITRRLCAFLPAEPQTHRLYHGVLHTPPADAPVDDVLVAYFAEGRSFTGEETTEISCHGGAILTSMVLNSLVSQGCRLANRGEFTYRAFLNGRLDLVQAEAVLGLIESQSKQAARNAFRQLQGGLSVDFAQIEDDLLWMQAHLEASIDFSTEDIEVVSSSELIERGERVSRAVAKLISTYQKGRVLKEGLEIALTGKPNVGKSSLLNAFLGEDRAIVTAIAGTTRDTVDGRIAIAGVPVTFVDTAGLRETNDQIELAGIERSRRAIGRADLIFHVIDLSDPDWRAQVEELVERIAGYEKNSGSDHRELILLNKADVCKPPADELLSIMKGSRFFVVSAETRLGIDSVTRFVETLVESLDSQGTSVITQARHLEVLQKIQTCLHAALRLISGNESPEFVAFELHQCLRAIHELLGKEFDEQVIDRIFKEFCLGK